MSGWEVEYRNDDPLVNEMIPKIRETHSLGEPYEDGIWINTLFGVGASIGEHVEGRAEGDVTAVIFLSTLGSRDGGELLIEGQDPITPKRGEYVVFLSKTKHQVLPMKTERERVTAGILFHKL